MLERVTGVGPSATESTGNYYGRMLGCIHANTGAYSDHSRHHSASQPTQISMVVGQVIGISAPVGKRKITTTVKYLRQQS